MILLAAALALAAPVQVAANPYDEGVAARLAGDNARAASLLGRVVEAEPDNADATLQLGLALLALGRLDEAEAALRRTLAIAPTYDDARVGLARLALRRDQPERAQAELDLVRSANADAAALREQISARLGAPGARWRLDIDGAYSGLDGQPDWTDGSLRLGYQHSASTALAAAIEPSRRFGQTDIYGEARLDRRFSPGASFYALVGGTPNADFRPEWQIGLGGAFRLRPGPRGTVLTLDARQASYRAGDVQTVTPGLDQYFAGGTAWIGARWINVIDQDGEHRSGWLLRGDVMAGAKLRLFAGASDAPDSSEGIVIRTSGLFGGLSYDVSERMSLRASVAYEDRSTGADRRTFGLGAGWTF